jgi:phage tail-like protein
MAEEKKKPGAQPGVFNDPYRAYNFKLEIDGVNEGHFTQCTNIGVEVDAISYREGGVGQIVHRLPGQVKYASIRLAYGLTASKELWDWFMGSVKGKVQRKSVFIVMINDDGATEAFRWHLVNAWPSAWRGAPLDALGREVAVEEVELVYETLDRG